jgi:hypothetical protein
MILYKPSTAKSGTLGGFSPQLLLGDRQRAGALIAYLYDPDEDDVDDGGEWLYDVDGDEEFIEYGFGPGRRKVYNGSVGDASINERQPPSEYSRKGPLGSTAKLHGQSQQIPLPISPPPPPLASGLPLPSGHPSKMRIPAPRLQMSWHSSISFRGFSNVSSLVILIVGLLALFIVFPIVKAFSDNDVEMKILGNTRINATGQAIDNSRRESLGDLITVKFEPEGH